MRGGMGARQKPPRIRDDDNHRASGRMFYIQIIRDLVEVDATLAANGLHAARFAAARGVSEKTVRRWVAVLRELGFQIESRLFKLRDGKEHRWQYVRRGRLFANKNSLAISQQIERSAEDMAKEEWLVMLRLPPDWQDAVRKEAEQFDSLTDWVKSLVAAKLKRAGHKVSAPRKRGRPKTKPAE